MPGEIRSAVHPVAPPAQRTELRCGKQPAGNAASVHRVPVTLLAAGNYGQSAGPDYCHLQSIAALHQWRTVRVAGGKGAEKAVTAYNHCVLSAPPWQKVPPDRFLVLMPAKRFHTDHSDAEQ